MSADDKSTVPAELVEVIAELQRRRDGLESAERDCERIPGLLAEAEKAAKVKKRGSRERHEALEAEAQAIRDRLRDARLDLQETVRGLVASVSGVAVRTETGRAVLEQLGRLSAYPAVRVGDQALSLLVALVESCSPATRSAPASQGEVSAMIASLPPKDPTPEHRSMMAELIQKAIAARGDSRKTAQSAVGISEHTLERLLDPDRGADRPFRKSTWEKALSFVKEALATPPDTHLR